MKVCPVCKTKVFEDMQVCYGCMYRFGSNPELEQRCAQLIGKESQNANDCVSHQEEKEQSVASVKDCDGERILGKEDRAVSRNTVRTVSDTLVMQSESAADCMPNTALRQLHIRLEAQSDEYPDQRFSVELGWPLEASPEGICMSRCD